MNRKRRSLPPVFILAVAFIAAGCAWLGGPEDDLSNPRMILIQTGTLTLTWAPPSTDIPIGFEEVAFYRVYFRGHGSIAWQELGRASADDHPEYTVHHADVGDGSFDFAVRSITVGGESSSLLTSSRADDRSEKGWYVCWIMGE